MSIGTDPDLFNLPAGQYRLTVTDANGCSALSEVYTITDAGDIQITDVQTTQPHCDHNDGIIEVTATSPSGSPLEYTIDGVNWQAANVFDMVSGGSYVIQAHDINGCIGSWPANPVELTAIAGPQLNDTLITDPTDGQSNGTIEIMATANSAAYILFYRQR